MSDPDPAELAARRREARLAEEVRAKPIIGVDGYPYGSPGYKAFDRWTRWMQVRWAGGRPYGFEHQPSIFCGYRRFSRLYLDSPPRVRRRLIKAFRARVRRAARARPQEQTARLAADLLTASLSVATPDAPPAERRFDA